MVPLQVCRVVALSCAPALGSASCVSAWAAPPVCSVCPRLFLCNGHPEEVADFLTLPLVFLHLSLLLVLPGRLLQLQLLIFLLCFIFFQKTIYHS